MVALIRHAISIRSTSATGVHDQSSRSHAILRIYIEQGEGAVDQDEVGEGVLTLVDLAGSEQNIDSMHHTADLRKEGVSFNEFQDMCYISILSLSHFFRSGRLDSSDVHLSYSTT